MRRLLRTRTGVLLFIGAAGAVTAWVVGQRGQTVAATMAWRLSFFCVLSAVVVNLPLIRAIWQGRAHLWATLDRAVPFHAHEFREGALLDVGRSRAGVTGRGALLGAGLAAIALLGWLAGLGFAPLDTSGTVDLRVGQKTSNVQPFGFRPDGVRYAHVLPHEHTVLSLTEDGQGVLVQALDPRTGESGVYDLRPGEPALLGPHRIYLDALADDPRAPVVTLRFTRTWVWWWRLLVLALAAAGVLLVVIIPHRSWVFVGRSGDLRLRAWSLNASGGLWRWSTEQLADALGDRGMAELDAVEAAISRADARH